jgi:hypothetical protein
MKNKNNSYTAQFKLTVISYTEKNGNWAAACEFYVEFFINTAVVYGIFM